MAEMLQQHIYEYMYLSLLQVPCYIKQVEHIYNTFL